MVYMRQAEPGRRDYITTLLITEVKHLQGNVVVDEGQLYRLNKKRLCTKIKETTCKKWAPRRIKLNLKITFNSIENHSIYLLILQSIVWVSIYLSLFFLVLSWLAGHCWENYCWTIFSFFSEKRGFKHPRFLGLNQGKRNILYFKFLSLKTMFLFIFYSFDYIFVEKWYPGLFSNFLQF